MRKLVFVVAFCVLMLSGCALLDAWLTPNEETGQSKGQTVVEKALEKVGGGVWGEAGLSAFILLQNGYLLWRKRKAGTAN